MNRISLLISFDKIILMDRHRRADERARAHSTKIGLRCRVVWVRMCLYVFTVVIISDKIKFFFGLAAEYCIYYISLSGAGNPDFVWLHKLLSNESRCVHYYVSASVCVCVCGHLSVCPTSVLCVQLTLYFPHNKLLFHFIFSSLFMCLWCGVYNVRVSLFLHLGCFFFFFLLFYLYLWSDIAGSITFHFVLACFGITFLFSHSMTSIQSHYCCGECC